MYDYEISFETTTEFKECEDSADTSKITLHKLTELSELNNVKNDAVLDVVVVLTKLVKQDIQLIDHSPFGIQMTLCGKTAETFDAPVESIIAFQGVKVGDLWGRNMSMLSSLAMEKK
ncbi:hypothetical protein MJO28_017933 [Puccinia striiformis f. sp. tritici]|nr:hypothetical protein MJO28_017933 [Puccinia striiformis f. sp. tritici]